MDDDSAAAVALYSAEWKPPSNAFYSKLNFAICCKEGRKNAPPFMMMLKLCLIALSKLCAPSLPFHHPSTFHTHSLSHAPAPTLRRKPFVGNVWRGVKKDLRAQFPKGKQAHALPIPHLPSLTYLPPPSS